MPNSTFQSYLILGTSPARRAKTQEILKTHGVGLAKISPDIFIISRKLHESTNIISAQKSKISIDQIRQLKSHIFQKPVSLKYKVIVIEEAENLTDQAQNALLKILEEPPASAVIILEARDKTRILPTILSRVVTAEVKHQGTTLNQGATLVNVKNTLTLLEEISKVENPQQWLDDQILALYNLLTAGAKLYHTGGDTGSHLGENELTVEEITSAIEACARAKQMLEANVNPKHVLANLILSLNQHVQA